MDKETTRKRSGVLSAIMSLVAPGLGFLYAGSWRLAISIPLGMFLMVAAFGWSRLVLYPAGFIACLFFIGVMFFGAVIGSFVLARRNSPCVLNKSQKWYLYILFLMASIIGSALLVGIRAPLFGYEPFRFPSGSMLDTLVPGDLMMVDTWAYDSKKPERGDIIVFHYPKNINTTFAKRLIGLPGERVSFRAGKVLINGQPLEEPYVNPENNIRSSSTNFASVRVPDNNYFVLGDNRDNSNDSRYWGFVPDEYLHGKVLYLWFSYGDREGARMERIGKQFQ